MSDFTVDTIPIRLDPPTLETIQDQRQKQLESLQNLRTRLRRPGHDAAHRQHDQKTQDRCAAKRACPTLISTPVT